MPFPMTLARLNARVTNHFMRPLAGRVAPLALVEHRGRRSGHTYTTPILAFISTDESRVTVALTYGSEVDWLANIREAGGCEMVQRRRRYALGPPIDLEADVALPRFPGPIRIGLRLLRVDEYIEFPVR